MGLGARTGSTVTGRRRVRGLRLIRRREDGQTTAEYALVLLAAAAVAFVLIAWAQSSDKLPAFFDMIIDSITGDVQ
jgi:Flp pilus assembly pilin Flp